MPTATTLMKAVRTRGARPEGRERFLWETWDFEEVVAVGLGLAL